MIRLKRERLLKAGQRGQRFRAIKLRFAHVAQAQELVAGDGLVFPAAAGEKEHDGEEHRAKEI